jgi:hypothetical protein
MRYIRRLMGGVKSARRCGENIDKELTFALRPKNQNALHKLCECFTVPSSGDGSIDINTRSAKTVYVHRDRRKC